MLEYSSVLSVAGSSNTELTRPVLNSPGWEERSYLALRDLQADVEALGETDGANSGVAILAHVC